MKTTLLAAAAITLLLLQAGELVAQGCGIQPMKPIPPIGCKDMVAACVCDINGKNCHWTWQCVPGPQ